MALTPDIPYWADPNHPNRRTAREPVDTGRQILRKGLPVESSLAARNDPHLKE
jgi:hypothetical protein